MPLITGRTAEKQIVPLVSQPVVTRFFQWQVCTLPKSGFGTKMLNVPFFANLALTKATFFVLRVYQRLLYLWMSVNGGIKIQL